MPNSKKCLLYGAVAALLAVTMPHVVMRYLRHLTATLLVLSLSSTVGLARDSGLFGPQTQAPRATAVEIPVDEARQIAATLSECEAVAVELEATREESAVLRRALDLTTKAAASFEAASVLNAERAENERKRAENEAFLRATAEANLKRERRAGRWRALRWAGAAIGVGLVIGFVAGGND